MKPPARAAIGRRPRLERYWRTGLSVPDKLIWSATIPAALLYTAATALRAGIWRIPSLKKKVAGTRVISVGNLTVGGNAKTPFTLYLARKLMDHGQHTGIVSRGYGGTLGSGDAVLVSDGRGVRLSAEQAGDEAVMMARTFQGPIAIARRRLDAITLIKQIAELDAVVLDDAFQHLRLARDLNLLLVSAERGFGNGWVLPAGPMRERLGAAARADARGNTGATGGPGASAYPGADRAVAADTGDAGHNRAARPGLSGARPMARGARAEPGRPAYIGG